MKITHVILLLFLVAKTSFGMDLIGLMSSDCCSSDKVEMCDTDGTPIEDEDNGCCDGPACECMCCGHVFLDFGSSQKTIQAPVLIHTAVFSYTSSSSLQEPAAIWHPPKIF